MYRDRDPDVFYGRKRPWEEPGEEPKGEEVQKDKGMPPTPGSLNSMVRDEAHWEALYKIAAFIREHGALTAMRVLDHADELLRGKR